MANWSSNRYSVAYPPDQPSEYGSILGQYFPRLKTFPNIFGRQHEPLNKIFIGQLRRVDSVLQFG